VDASLKLRGSQGADGGSGVIAHGRTDRHTLNKALVAKKKEETRYRGELRLRDIGVATPKLIHTPNRTRTEKGLSLSSPVGVGLQTPFEPQISRVMTEGERRRIRSECFLCWLWFPPLPPALSTS